MSTVRCIQPSLPPTSDAGHISTSIPACLTFCHTVWGLLQPGGQDSEPISGRRRDDPGGCRDASGRYRSLLLVPPWTWWYFAVAMSTVMPHTGSFAVVAGGGCISCFELDCRVCIFFQVHHQTSRSIISPPPTTLCSAEHRSCYLLRSLLLMAKCISETQLRRELIASG